MAEVTKGGSGSGGKGRGQDEVERGGSEFSLSHDINRTARADQTTSIESDRPHFSWAIFCLTQYGCGFGYCVQTTAPAQVKGNDFQALNA